MGHVLVPITTANGMGPLPQLLEEMTNATIRASVFAAEQLPPQLIVQQDIPVPQPLIANLFERSGRAAGDRLFGLRVGRMMEPASLGLWAEYVFGGDCLETALRRSVRAIPYHQVGAPMSLDRRGGHAVWRYRPAGGDLGRRHHTDHVIPLMSRLVKAYLGDDWRPAWIELDYPRDSDARILEGEFETELRFDCAAVGLAIAVEDLSRPHAGGTRGISGRSVTLSEVHADSKLRSPMDPGEAVESLVAMRLLDGAVDIEGTARMAGLSVRSLQRSLGQCGSTYTEIVESVRRRRASSLLAESNLPVTQIALSLGYSDPANFTRAFRRWSGTSPRAFRARAQPARAFTH